MPLPAFSTLPRTTLLFSGLLALSLLFNVLLTCNALKKHPDPINYAQQQKQLDEKILLEQKYQMALEQVIAASQKLVDTYTLRDSVLHSRQKQIILSIQEIEIQYAQIASRYRDLTKDSLRRALSK